MNIYEYQAKEILNKYKLVIPRGIVVDSLDSGIKAAKELKFPLVIKAQVHAGGRGKAGGVKLVSNLEEFENEFPKILGMDIKGLKVKKILLEKALDIKKQFYVSITLDRAKQSNVIIASLEGGVDIEETARTSPEKIQRVYLKRSGGLETTDLGGLNVFDEVSGRLKGVSFKEVIITLFKVYNDIDAQLLEINPLVLTAADELVACDAKIIIDDNALFRHEELKGLKEEAEDNALEIEAHKRNLAYVKLNGNVGIIGNGAGLVMATMDEVQRSGGKPADFLDVGGGTKRDVIQNALEVVLMDRDVEGIFMNIFGGITRCDEVANGIIQALGKNIREIPIVLRLSGNRSAEGKKILDGYINEIKRDPLLGKSNLISADSMEEGAKKIVAVVKGI